MIMNSTEWEITLNLYEFDELWMRYAKGWGSTGIKLTLFVSKDFILILQGIF